MMEIRANAFGVTIATSLKTEDVVNAAQLPYAHVIDIRCNQNGRAMPVDVAVPQRLNDLSIGFEQYPLDLENLSPRQENELLRMIVDQRTQVLVVTDQALDLAWKCHEGHIPFSGEGLYMVESGRGVAPAFVQS